jgi:hypothetical protein
VSRHRDLDQPRDPRVQVDITLTLPRQLAGLLTGVTIGHLDTFGRIVDTVGHLLRQLAA